MKHKCVLKMRYNTYHEYNGMDNDEIQQDFEDPYEAMHSKTRGIGAV